MDSEDLTCSICLEVFEQPHTLPCLHTFCKNCIDKCAANRRKVECPQCRESYNAQMIKHNFMVQKYIDRLKSQEKLSAATKNANKTCKVCKNVSIKITCKCIDCDQILCENCEKAHKGLEITKNHKLIDIHTLVNPTKSTNQKSKKLLNEEKSDLFTKMKDLNDKIDEVKRKQTQQHKELITLNNKLIRKIEAHCFIACLKLQQAIDSQTEELMKQLHETNNIYRNRMAQIDDDLRFLKRLRKCEGQASCKAVSVQRVHNKSDCKLFSIVLFLLYLYLVIFAQIFVIINNG